MTCPNCQTPITCGCQKRVADDGTATCASCVASYNAGVVAAAGQYASPFFAGTGYESPAVPAPALLNDNYGVLANPHLAR